jgi:hypothetical protein
VTLDELAAVVRAAPAIPGAPVPGWTVGCWRRRSITYFTGASDLRTQVYWLQTRGLTADLRVAARRPPLPGRGGIDACTPAELLALLAAVEGGLAQTAFAGEQMSWQGWTSFQTHARWPEPGRLARVGDALIELAPSGAYVEDWRFQHSPAGPLVGLALLEERVIRPHGPPEIRHRGGGLVVAGRHAAFVRGRARAIESQQRLPGWVAAQGDVTAALRAVFGCEISYGCRPGGQSGEGGERSEGDAYVVQLSTHPWREGQPLLALDGFEYDRANDRVIQRVTEEGLGLERVFAVDTLEAEVTFPHTTRPAATAAAWLDGEADALLADVE